jgi:hypothetical protein
MSRHEDTVRLRHMLDHALAWDIIELDLPTLVEALRRALDGAAR